VNCQERYDEMKMMTSRNEGMSKMRSRS